MGEGELREEVGVGVDVIKGVWIQKVAFWSILLASHPPTAPHFNRYCWRIEFRDSIYVALTNNEHVSPSS